MDAAGKGDGKLVGRIVAICFWIALWVALAAFVGNDILLAGPVATVRALVGLVASGGFWMAVGLSGGRIVISACVSAVVGILLGMAAAKWRVLDTLLEVPIQIMKSAPVACVVVVLLVAFGSVGAIVVIVAFVALPPFYIASLEAARAKEGDDARVLELMGLSGAGVFLASTWPAILPLYRHAAKTAVALSWRAGITGELLSIPLGSMGAAIYVSKLTLDTPALLAWTAVVMLLAFACEFVVVRLLDASAASPKLALRLGHGSEASAGKGTADDAPATLIITDITKAYGDKTVLERIDLELSPSERMCLMAPTGSGKSTLIRLMTGMEIPEGGSASHPELIGIVLQHPTLSDRLSAWENVLLVADPSRSKDGMRRQLEGLLPEAAADKSASSLSGGTKRLVEIARALFSPGECVILDEPFAGLDPASKERACAFILENLAGRPLVIATHEKADADLLNASIFEL